MNSIEVKMKITESNYDDTKNQMCEFFLEEINKFIRQFGSKRSLSLALGYEPPYVWLILKRAKHKDDNFVMLERLWKECVKKIKR